MLSKVYAKGKASSVAWRPSGAGAARAASGEPTLQSEYERGVRDGRMAAETDAAQRSSAQLTPVLANLGSVVQQIAATRQRFRMEAEEQTVQLAIAIAARILHREIATDPEAILGLVRAGCDRLNAREAHRLRLSPADIAIVQQHRDVLGMPQNVEIVNDSSLGPGSAIFETERGELDASAYTQLEEIQRGFADIVRRRRQ